MEFIMHGDLLREVLLRLPVKFLFRCNLVSKQWRSTISDPSFARMYAARASQSAQSQWILMSCFARKHIVQQFFEEKIPLQDCGIKCLDLLRLPQLWSVSVSSLSYLLVGISNGLLLYSPELENVDSSGRVYSSYEIYDPTTGQIVTIPPHEHRCQSVILEGFVTRIEDNNLDSYRILRIDADRPGNSHGSFSYEVYLSEVQGWVGLTSDEFNQEILFDSGDNWVVIDKTLHRLVGAGHLMWFNLYDNPGSVRRILLPPGDGAAGEGSVGGEHLLLDEHRGHLRFLQLLRGQSNMFFLSLWTLIDYSSGKWYLQIRVILDNSSCDVNRDILLRPISFHPFLSNILYMLHEERHCQYLYSYDMKAGKFKHLPDDSSETSNLFPIPCRCWPFFLYVAPPWPLSMNLRTLVTSRRINGYLLLGRSLNGRRDRLTV